MLRDTKPLVRRLAARIGIAGIFSGCRFLSSAIIDDLRRHYLHGVEFIKYRVVKHCVNFSVGLQDTKHSKMTIGQNTFRRHQTPPWHIARTIICNVDVNSFQDAKHLPHGTIDVDSSQPNMSHYKGKARHFTKVSNLPPLLLLISHLLSPAPFRVGHF